MRPTLRVALATCTEFPEGEPGHEHLDAELERRGHEGSWVCWDDPDVPWASFDLVAVRSTWDYVARHEEFLGWARRVERDTVLLNGADVFAWNLDKAYLARLGELATEPGAGSPAVVPTALLGDGAPERAALVAARAEFGDLVVKPRVGAGGVGVVVVRRDADLDQVALDPVPSVAQPLVDSVRTTGELSVFVLDQRPVSMVIKVPGTGEIRVHEHLGGSSRPVDLDPELGELAVATLRLSERACGRPLTYGRVDLLHHDGRWRVSEVEVTEPGLYLDVVADNASAFTDTLERAAV